MGFWRKMLGRPDSPDDVQDSIRVALGKGDRQAAMTIIARVLTSLLDGLPTEKLSALRSLDASLGPQFLSLRLIIAFRRGWRTGGDHPLEKASREVTAEIEFLIHKKPAEILTALADRINDYFRNAIRIFAANNDQSARTAALAAAKVAARGQRESMVDYLRAMASDYRTMAASSGDLPTRLDELAAEISSKDWQLEDIRAQKLLLGKEDPEYLEALEGSDPTIFLHRFPHLFERIGAPPTHAHQQDPLIFTVYALTMEEARLLAPHLQSMLDAEGVDSFVTACTVVPEVEARLGITQYPAYETRSTIIWQGSIPSRETVQEWLRELLSSRRAMTGGDSSSAPWDGPLIRQKIREWFQTGRSQSARYLLICQDTFDLHDPDMGIYPYYAQTVEEARRFAAEQLTGIDLLLEVLDLAQELDAQLSRARKKDLDGLE